MYRDQDGASAQALRGLADLWFARRGVDGFPRRADFSPQDVRPWMGWIAIFRAVERTPLRLHVRLHGTYLAAKTGYDLTGKTLPDDAPNDCRPFMAGMALALERALPVYEWIDAPGVLTYARLVLPVASTTANADTLITTTNATDLRSGPRQAVSLARAIGQVSGPMQRRVLTGPTGPDPAAIPQAPADGPGAGAG